MAHFRAVLLDEGMAIQRIEGRPIVIDRRGMHAACVATSVRGASQGQRQDSGDRGEKEPRHEMLLSGLGEEDETEASFT